MKYTINTYPDSQVTASVYETEDPLLYIKERINNYADLFKVAAIVDAARTQRSPHIILDIPCLFGQRSDVRFKENESFDLKIITNFINSLDLEQVFVFDPHSNVSLGLLNNSTKRSSFGFVKQTISALENGNGWGKNLTLVSPDSGAYKKVFSYAEDLKLPLVAANKFRDRDGKITLNILGDVKGKDCLIVDDLLDGGSTFHLLAEQLKQQGASKVFLYVSHAYFNKGIDFTPYIDHFYCTNSVKDITHDKVTQFDL